MLVILSCIFPYNETMGDLDITYILVLVVRIFTTRSFEFTQKY